MFLRRNSEQYVYDIIYNMYMKFYVFLHIDESNEISNNIYYLYERSTNGNKFYG